MYLNSVKGFGVENAILCDAERCKEAADEVNMHEKERLTTAEG